MDCRVSVSQTRRSYLEPPKVSQDQVPDGIASAAAGLLQDPNEPLPKSRRLPGDEALPCAKRRLDRTSETHPLPATKRVRVETSQAQKPRLRDERPEQVPKSVGPVDPPPSDDSSNTIIFEWLESIGSDPEKRCWSDSHLALLDDGPLPTQRPRSAPEMARMLDSDGFTVPPTPTATGVSSDRAAMDAKSPAPSDASDSTRGTGRSSSRSLVEDPFYRDRNLFANGIYLRPTYEDLPEHVASVVDQVRKTRDSPGPSPDQLRQDTELFALEMGAEEPRVEEYFRTNVFPYPKSTETLDRVDRHPMAKHTVPTTGSTLKVSTPVPDMLYGYSRHAAFPQQQSQLISMGSEADGAANNRGLMYPFLVIEFKGDGPTGVGSLWVATNQCLGDSASCVNISERLNRQLRQCRDAKVQPIDSASFSVALNGTEARLYISWKHGELDYYTRKVKSFLLQEPEHYIEFRKYVWNIIDWGRDRRLEEIRESLDSLLEESRKRASEAAKSRPPPSDSSSASRGKRHRPSSPRRNSSRSDSGQGQSREEGQPYWKWDETAGQWSHTTADGTVIWAE